MDHDNTGLIESVARFQSHLSIMLTRRCNIRCRHCCVESLPAKARGGDIVASDLHDWLGQAGHISKIKRVSLTGGEPFLVYPLLREAVHLAATQDLQVEIVSSGYWATSLVAAQRKLECFTPWEENLQLFLSVDRFHQEFVPLERIRNAIIAAHEIGIDQITVKLGYLGMSATEGRAWLLRQIGPVPDTVTIQTQLIHRTGRAAQAVDRDEFIASPEQCQHVGLSRILCPTADFPLITPEGNVYACCGTALLLKHSTPLWLGNLHASGLNEILDRSEMNLLLHFIRLYGPLQLLKCAGREVLLEESESTSLCALCLKLFSSPGDVARLEEQLETPAWKKWQRQIAVDRLLYFNEPDMLLKLSV